MKKWLIFMSLAIAFSGVFALGGAKTAEASSAYDNAYVPFNLPQEWIPLNNTTYSKCANPFTLTETNWSSFIHDRLKIPELSENSMDNIQNSFNTAVNNPDGIWGFSQAGSYSTLHIFWAEDSLNPQLNWTTEAGVKYVRVNSGLGANIRSVEIECRNNSATPVIVVSQYNFPVADFTISSQNSNGSMSPFRNGLRANGLLSVPDGFDFNYPMDYEGEEDIITDFVPPPTVRSDTPAIQLVSLGNFKFEFYDNNFVNSQVNEPPFYCGLSTFPDVIWEIIDNNASTIMSGHFRADKKAEFQHTPSQVDEIYTLYATYDCPDDPQIEFDSGIQIPYSTSSNGWLVAPAWNSCIIDGFPWVDVQECLNNLTRVINSLSFGTIKFDNPDAWVVSEVCYNTTTIHTWLGSNTAYNLCPQFSEEVRNIVTPFVTFLLGLLTITFITKRTGSGFSG